MECNDKHVIRKIHEDSDIYHCENCKMVFTDFNRLMEKIQKLISKED